MYKKIEDFNFIVVLCCGVIALAGSIVFGGRWNSIAGGKVLQASNVSTNEVRFYYDAGGKRIGKIDPSGDNIYYISPDLEIIVSKEGRVDWRRNYFFNGRAVAVRNSKVVPTPTSLEPQ